MSDLIIEEKNPTPEQEKFSPAPSADEPKPHTRIALITAIIFIVITMFGLGVYIIENTPATVSEFRKNQSVKISSNEQNSSAIGKGRGQKNASTTNLSNVNSDLDNNSAGKDKTSFGSELSSSNDGVFEPNITGKNVELVESSGNAQLEHARRDIDIMQISEEIDAEIEDRGNPDTMDDSMIAESTIMASTVSNSDPFMDSEIEEANITTPTPIALMETNPEGNAIDNSEKSKNVDNDNRRPLVPGMRLGRLNGKQSNPSTMNSIDNGQRSTASLPPPTGQTRIASIDTSPPQTKQNQFTNLEDNNDDIQALRESIALLNPEFKESQLTKQRSTKSLFGADDTLAIIVNSQNNQDVSISDLRNFYTDKIIKWDSGKKISIYHLPLDSEARAIFSKQILKMTSLEAATLESNRVITNSSINRSVTKVSKLVKAYVARNPGAIGYIPLSDFSDDSGIRIVMTLNN